MIEFQSVKVTDKDIFNKYLLKNPYCNCDFSFSNIFIWRNYYKTRYAIIDDFLIVESKGEGFLMPVGEGDLRPVLQKMIAYAEEKNRKFKMFAVTKEGERRLEEAMPGAFSYNDNRDWYDYIYNTDDLINLKGKKFHAKRNHINRFMQDYSFECIPIEAGMIPEILKMHELWCEENYDENNEEQQSEAFAVKEALLNFEALGLCGMAIKIDQTFVAFSLGQPLNDKVFCVHIEKALSQYATAYTVINKCFAEHCGSRFPYINREEDLGLPGLRKAKLSYHPEYILEKRLVVLKK